jgi:tetratricopeptide (TPR) repeat protein
MNKTIGAIAALSLQFVAFDVGYGAEVTPQKSDAPKTSEASGPKDLLNRARIYTELESYDEAQKDILEALKAMPQESAERQEAIKLWHQAEQAKREQPQRAKPSDRRKITMKLDEARRLASQGKITEADTKVTEAVANTSDPDLLRQAEEISAQSRATLGGMVSLLVHDALTAVGWILDIILALVLIAVVYFILCTLRKCTVNKKEQWRLGTIDDRTNNGIADFIITALARWRAQSPPATAGLLQLETLQLPMLPTIREPTPQLDLEAALQSLNLQIGTVNVGGAAKLISAIRSWFNALKPSISGIAFTKDTQIVVHLLKRSANSDTSLATGVSDAAHPEKAAESATFKMYYLIAKNTTVPDAELANKVREGLNQLSQYVSGRDPNQLQAAYETFRDVVQEKPTHEEASLYEGIALDLLERHEEAISRFEYLAKNADDKIIRHQATYNAAVSRFRKYEPDALQDAITRLANFVGQEDPTELAKSPLLAMAYAAEANGIAHKSIFWQTIIYGNRTTDATEKESRKRQSASKVLSWVQEVERMAFVLDEVLATDGAKNWDPLARRQLKWATCNAKGNAYLNFATMFLKGPEIVQDEGTRPKVYLENALTAFQQCEVLLPAGVETLTNLATAFMALGRLDEGRNYAERAVTLNPNYEYAYYRLAESWADENRKDEAVKWLSRFPKSPRIPGFKELFTRYYVEPKAA